MVKSIKQQMQPVKFKEVDIKKSAGILDDFAVRKVISTQEITGNPKLNSFTTGSIPFIDADKSLIENNANLFWDNTNKRLGIGTTNPTGVLEVVTNISSGRGFLFTNTGAHSRLTTTNGATMFLDSSSGNFQVKADFFPNADVSVDFGSSTRRWKTFYSAKISDNGTNVGIGTTSPSEALHVEGFVKVGSQLKMRTDSGVGKIHQSTDATRLFINAGSSQSSSAGAFLYLAGEDYGGVDSGGDAELSAGLHGSVSLKIGDTEKLTVLNSGSVDVAGDFTAGTIQADDGFTGTGAYTNFTIVGGIITAAS